MQPEEIFQHNELSQVPNEKCLQEVHPILPTGKINHLIPGCLELHEGPAPDLDSPKKKMVFAAWEVWFFPKNISVGFWVQGIPVFIFNVSNLWQHCGASEGELLKWDLASPYREGSVVRSDATSSPEGKSSLTISTCVQLPSPQIWRASGYGFYWYWQF